MVEIMIFIICHDSLPQFNIPENAKIVWLNSKPALNAAHLDVIDGYAYFENPEELHDRMAGAMGSFVISRYISECDEKPKRVTIWQYRKFVTKKKFGTISRRYPGMFIVPLELASSISIGEIKDIPYIVPMPIKVGNTLIQYASAHNVLDFLRYVCAAIENDVLTQHESAFFLNSSILIPGGMELGTYPTEWWMEAICKLERVATAFYEKHVPWDAEHPYQKRAISFCQERLGSHLLQVRLSELYSGSSVEEAAATMHTVTDAPDYV